MLKIKEKVAQNWRGGQNRNERTKEINNFKNKVMVQESQYSSDWQFRGNLMVVNQNKITSKVQLPVRLTSDSVKNNNNKKKLIVNLLIWLTFS